MQSKSESRYEYVTEVSNRGRAFRFKEPLLFSPYFEEETLLYVFEHEGLGISIYAEEFGDLREELADQVRFLWDAYALAKDDILSPGALQLKQRLLSDVEEVEGAKA